MDDWFVLASFLILTGILSLAASAGLGAARRAATVTGFMVLGCLSCTFAYVAGQGDVREHVAVLGMPVSDPNVFLGRCLYQDGVRFCATDTRDARH